MTDAEATRLAAEHDEYERELSKARSRGHMADVHYYEARMASIEGRFTKADLYLDDYRKRNDL